MISLLKTRQAARVGVIAALVLWLGASLASAETLLMPKRDFLMGANEVVWGITTQANTTAYVIDFGDGVQQSGNVADRSYIAFNHTYNVSGPLTAQMCVGAGAAIPGCPGELATVQVNVHNGANLSAFDLRALNINRTIQNALRFLWTTQINRAANILGATTQWSGGSGHGGVEQAVTALAVLAFENHGYLLPSNPATPATGIYEKYIVERGLNFLGSTLTQLTLTLQTANFNRDPCVGTGIEAVPCVGLYDPNDAGYSNAVIALPFAGSTALNRTFPAGLGGASGVYITGKTYREVLQRVMNALAWGQNDTGTGRGGWIYNFSNNAAQVSDGSTIGWDVLALLDSGAAGVTIPPWVLTEFRDFALQAGRNTNGSFDYQADGNQATLNNVNFQKGGILLQAFFYVGQIGTGDAQVNTTVNYLNDRWAGAAVGGDTSSWRCGSPASANIPCVYGMFNAFKGLKLQGVQTLSNVGRAAGPGPIPANDWHAAYEDWLVTNQTNPLTTGGGNWANLGWSCCQTSSDLTTAGGLLILSSVALIQPDPTLFSTVGLSPATAVNPPRTAHTVTALAQSAGTPPIPVPGATITFRVISGPNINQTGQGVTNAQGQATFTYTDTASTGPWPKTDEIQAFIGTLGSNIVEKVWTLRCDADGNGRVENADLIIIRNANGQNASSAYDPRDGNADGVINVSDYRFCQLRLGTGI